MAKRSELAAYGKKPFRGILARQIAADVGPRKPHESRNVAARRIRAARLHVAIETRERLIALARSLGVDESHAVYCPAFRKLALRTVPGFAVVPPKSVGAPRESERDYLFFVRVMEARRKNPAAKLSEILRAIATEDYVPTHAKEPNSVRRPKIAKLAHRYRTMFDRMAMRVDAVWLNSPDGRSRLVATVPADLDDVHYEDPLMDEFYADPPPKK